jgi:hypothetical protein
LTGHLDLRHAHPARRRDDETQASVVDDDHVNAFLFASAQRVFLNRPGSGRFEVEISVRGLPGVEMYVA